MRTKSLERQRGGETVEFALFTLPVLVLVFSVFVEFGFAFADRAVIVDASRAAAREAIRGASIQEVCDAADRVLASTGTWGTSTPYSCGGDACPSTECDVNPNDPAALNPGDPVEVALSFPFQFRILTPLSDIALLSFIPDFSDTHVSGRTVMYMQPH